MGTILIDLFEGGYCFLSQYVKDISGGFPALPDVIDALNINRMVYKRFMSLNKYARNDYINFITGKDGLLIRNNTFFTKIFDINTNPRLVEAFIDATLNKSYTFYNSHPRCASFISPLDSFVIADIEFFGFDSNPTHIVVTKNSGEELNEYTTADELVSDISRKEMGYAVDFASDDFSENINVVIFDHTPAAINASLANSQYIKTYNVPQSDLQPAIKTICIFLDEFAKRGNAKSIDSCLEAWLSFICFTDEESIVYLCNHTKYFYSIYRNIYKLIDSPVELLNIFSEIPRNSEPCDNASYIAELTAKIEYKDKEIAELSEKIEELTIQNKELLDINL